MFCGQYVEKTKDFLQGFVANMIFTNCIAKKSRLQKQNKIYRLTYILISTLGLSLLSLLTFEKRLCHMKCLLNWSPHSPNVLNWWFSDNDSAPFENFVYLIPMFFVFLLNWFEEDGNLHIGWK